MLSLPQLCWTALALGVALQALPASSAGLPMPCEQLTGVQHCIECLSGKRQCFLCAPTTHYPVRSDGKITEVSRGRPAGWPVPVGAPWLSQEASGRWDGGAEPRCPTSWTPPLLSRCPQCKAASLACAATGPKDPNCAHCAGTQCLRCIDGFAFNDSNKVSGQRRLAAVAAGRGLLPTQAPPARPCSAAAVRPGHRQPLAVQNLLLK